MGGLLVVTWDDDEGGVYAGGSLRPWGRGEGVVETWQNGPSSAILISIYSCTWRDNWKGSHNM